jgi:hypothetical protein
VWPLPLTVLFHSRGYIGKLPLRTALRARSGHTQRSLLARAARSNAHRGPSIFGCFAPATGPQQILRIHKMRKFMNKAPARSEAQWQLHPNTFADTDTPPMVVTSDWGRSVKLPVVKLSSRKPWLVSKIAIGAAVNFRSLTGAVKFSDMLSVT